MESDINVTLPSLRRTVLHTDKRYMDLKENVQWFSIFLLLLLSLMHSSYIFLCLLWTIEIIVIGNVKRIHSQNSKNNFVNQTVFIYNPSTISFDY